MSDSPKPPRISSPLNPSRSPHNSLPPGESPPALPVPPTGRPRGHSLSSMLGAKQARSRSSSPRTPRPPGSPSHSPSPGHSHSASQSRSRSRSPAHDRLIASALLESSPQSHPPTPPTPPNAPPSTWWGRSLRRERPWRDPSPSPSPSASPQASPRLGAKTLLVKPRAQSQEDEWGEDEAVTLKRRSTLTSIPKEQTEGWERTRERVAQALKEIIPTSALIAHDLLSVGAEALRFAPIPGLDVAASLLLNIWDSVQAVDINRLACLRLAERCANILLSVREEVRGMGGGVEGELEGPVGKLVETYTTIHLFLLKQAHRPFLKRYLKREEVLREIAACDRGLGDALGMFSISIQLRILRQVRDAETQREGDRRVLEALARAGGVPGVGNALGLALEGPEGQVTPRVGVHDLPPYSEQMEGEAHEEGVEGEREGEAVIPTLLSLHTAQNTLDTAHDAADLRALMREALAQSSDVEMLRVLQVRRDEMPEALKTLQRALERVGYVPQVPQTPVEVDSSESGSGSSDGRVVARDTLDREFIEGGIDALRRMSKGGGVLPSWTITRYEVDRDAKIGIGFFSSVYRGTWRNRTVAIKCLAPQTPRELFLREVSIWRTLKHPHVLELYGASGASGDGPWFFVCPYERFGSLSGFLRRAAQEGKEGKEGKGEGREGDLLRFMHEIAKGMEYLHHQGVLHGDLKASNVLVDDRIHCLVADFGQSEMKSEAYRISGTAPPHGGTLRWQAPELMLGSSVLTPEMDVYSFAICCIEILLMGRMPWPLMSDEAVRNFVLRDKTRPQIPPTRFSTPALQEVLRLCWHEDPASRPQFYKIVRELKQQRRDAERPLEGHDELMSPPISPHVPSWEELEDAAAASHHSPDMRPVPLPKTQSPDMRPVPLPKTPPMDVPRAVPFPNKGASPEASSSDSYHTVSQSWPPFGPLESHEEDTVSSDSEAPEPVVYTSSVRSRASSVFTPSAKSSSTEDLAGLLDLSLSGYESPMPEDERIAAIRNERRYRLLLVHDFHPSLTLPLWNPLPISLGAVGFVDRLSGLFVTLLNCFYPDKAAEGAGEGMPSVYGYGRVTTGNQRQDKRTAAQRGLDAIAGLLTFRRSAVDSSGPITQHVSRRYSFPLRSGHKAAYMCTESTMYRYVENLDAPKKWFRANVDTIMAKFGARHQLQKEDLRLVIGTLDAPDYALFVSHNHPNGQAHFNVYSAPKTGQPWGTFTTDTEPELATGGPSYNEPILGNPSSACRVSRIGGQWDTVLVARLRFKPDVLEPTSL